MHKSDEHEQIMDASGIHAPGYIRAKMPCLHEKTGMHAYGRMFAQEASDMYRVSVQNNMVRAKNYEWQPGTHALA